VVALDERVSVREGCGCVGEERGCVGEVRGCVEGRGCLQVVFKNEG